MKTVSFVLLSLATTVFLSCNFTPEQSQDCATSATIASKIAAKELDSSCKSEGKKLVSILDIQPKEEIDWDYVYSHLPGYIPGSGYVPESGISTPSGSAYNVNGIDMTQEEYDVYKAEYWRKYGEELSKDRKRDLPIPCVASDDVLTWTAWLTDGEIAELKEKYDGLTIEDIKDYDYEDIPFVITPGYNGSEENESDYGSDYGCH